MEGLERTGRGALALTSQELESSLVQAAARKISLCDLLIVERQMPEEAVAEAFGKWLNVPCVSLASVDIDTAALKKVPASLARKHTCLPIQLSGKKLVLAMANPADRQTIQDIQFASS